MGLTKINQSNIGRILNALNWVINNASANLLIILRKTETNNLDQMRSDADPVKWISTESQLSELSWFKSSSSAFFTTSIHLHSSSLIFFLCINQLTLLSESFRLFSNVLLQPLIGQQVNCHKHKSINSNQINKRGFAVFLVQRLFSFFWLMVTLQRVVVIKKDEWPSLEEVGIRLMFNSDWEQRCRNTT